MFCSWVEPCDTLAGSIRSLMVLTGSISSDDPSRCWCKQPETHALTANTLAANTIRAVKAQSSAATKITQISKRSPLTCNCKTGTSGSLSVTFYKEKSLVILLTLTWCSSVTSLTRGPVWRTPNMCDQSVPVKIYDSQCHFFFLCVIF